MEDASQAEAVRRRVETAFNQLEEQGFAVRTNCACCMSCAIAELADIAEQEGRDRAVYWHEQDEEHFRAGGPLHIRYCHLPESCAEEHAADFERDIANQVAAALKNAGLQIEWGGSPRTTIQVTGIARISATKEEDI